MSCCQLVVHSTAPRRAGFVLELSPMSNFCNGSYGPAWSCEHSCQRSGNKLLVGSAHLLPSNSSPALKSDTFTVLQQKSRQKRNELVRYEVVNSIRPHISLRAIKLEDCECWFFLSVELPISPSVPEPVLRMSSDSRKSLKISIFCTFEEVMATSADSIQ